MISNRTRLLRVAAGYVESMQREVALLAVPWWKEPDNAYVSFIAAELIPRPGRAVQRGQLGGEAIRGRLFGASPTVGEYSGELAVPSWGAGAGPGGVVRRAVSAVGEGSPLPDTLSPEEHAAVARLRELLPTTACAYGGRAAYEVTAAVVAGLRRIAVNMELFPDGQARCPFVEGSRDPCTLWTLEYRTHSRAEWVRFTVGDQAGKYVGRK